LSLFHDHSDPDTDYPDPSDPATPTMSGTSMAAPLAAAVAALVWSQNPDWSADQVRQRLYASADPIDSLPCNNFPGDLIDSDTVGKALDFDGVNEALEHNTAPRPTSITVETVTRFHQIGTTQVVVGMEDGNFVDRKRSCWLGIDSSDRAKFLIYLPEGEFVNLLGATSVSYTGHSFYVAGKHDESTGNTGLWVDDTEEASGTNVKPMRDTGNYGWAIAKASPDRSTHYLNGDVSEVRISKIARPDEWLRATYHTLFRTLFIEATSSSTSSSWENYKQYTIDSAKVDSDLTDFPVTIILDSDDSDFFIELLQDSDGKKIKVTTDLAGTNQCYVEIEHFSASSQKCVLHTKIPSISSSSDTEIYLWYDRDQPDNTTYVGDTGDAVAQNVWDDDFLGVYHMAQEPGSGTQPRIKDSTSNGYDLASENMESGYAYKMGTGRINAFQAVYTDNPPVNRPPVLDPIEAKSVNEGDPLEFTITASDPDPGDGLTYTASNLPTEANFNPATQFFSWTPGFGDTGNYTVTFTVTDDGTPPASDFEDVTITVGDVNRPPTADFTWTTRRKRVRFTDNSNDDDGTIVSWFWNFGDGNTSDEQNPTHRYRLRGTYTVTLTVTDDDGTTDTIGKNATVQ
jgi:hypothetical protein